MPPLFVGIAGGTCCGKSDICKKITQLVTQGHTNYQIITLEHTNFYRKFTGEERELAEVGKFNFDHPDTFDNDLVLKVIKQLKKGERVSIPTYNYVTNTRDENYPMINPPDIVLFVGILALHDKDIRDLLDVKVFLDTDDDTRLIQRVLRDTVVGCHREIDDVLNEYTTFVKRSFEDFVLPTKRYADVIIPKGDDHTIGVESIVKHIQEMLCTTRYNNNRHRISGDQHI